MNHLLQFMPQDGRHGSESSIRKVLTMLLANEQARSNSLDSYKRQLETAVNEHSRVTNRLRAAEAIGPSAESIAVDCRKRLAALETDIRSAKSAVAAYRPTLQLSEPCDLPPLEADEIYSRILGRDVATTPLRDRVLRVDRTEMSYTVDLFDGRRVDLLSGASESIERGRRERREDERSVWTTTR